MRWQTVGRDVVLIFLLTAVAGFIIGFAAASNGTTPSAAVLGASNIGLSIVGFAISGSLTRTDRPRHLFTVAVFTWLLSLINVLLGYTLLAWLVGGVAILFACVVGWGIAALLFRPPRAVELGQAAV